VKFKFTLSTDGMLNIIILGVVQLDSIIDEFNRFLNLGYSWNRVNFCPSIIIDLVWHASMLDNEKYNELTSKFVGKLLSHCFEETKKHEERYGVFLQIFKNHHRQNVMLSNNLKVFNDNDVSGSLKHRYNEAQLELEKIKEQQRIEEENRRQEEEKNRRIRIEKEKEHKLKLKEWDEKNPVNHVEIVSNYYKYGNPENPYLEDYERIERIYYKKIRLEIEDWESKNPGQRYP